MPAKTIIYGTYATTTETQVGYATQDLTNDALKKQNWEFNTLLTYN